MGLFGFEEKARAKDIRGKEVIGGNANFVQKNINSRKNNPHKAKKKPPPYKTKGRLYK